jgi:hypothetical protein
LAAFDLTTEVTRIDISSSLRWRWWQRLFFHRNHRNYKATRLIRFFFLTFRRFGWTCSHIRSLRLYITSIVTCGVAGSIFCGIRSQRNLAGANKFAPLAKSTTGNPIASYDDGKTWSAFAPPAGDAVPEQPTVEQVMVNWERKED